MPLTPADVHNVVFKKPPIGKRGYDEDEVDAFLDVVEAELARLIEENNELRAGGGRAPVREERPEPPAAPVVQAPPPPVQPPAPREDDSARASRMLALATETADKYVNEAKTQAEQMLVSAKTNSDRMLTEARSKSEQMVTEAKHPSLERKIEELRTFEREYRTRLRSYLESHLRDLDSRGSAEPALGSRQNQHAPA